MSLVEKKKLLCNVPISHNWLSKYRGSPNYAIFDKAVLTWWFSATICVRGGFYISWLLTLESGINVPLHLIFFWLFSRGYGLILDFIEPISIRYKWGYAFSFCQIFQGLRLFQGVRLFRSLEKIKKTFFFSFNFISIFGFWRGLFLDRLKNFSTKKLCPIFVWSESCLFNPLQ